MLYTIKILGEINKYGVHPAFPFCDVCDVCYLSRNNLSYNLFVAHSNHYHYFLRYMTPVSFNFTQNMRFNAMSNEIPLLSSSNKYTDIDITNVMLTLFMLSNLKHLPSILKNALLILQSFHSVLQ